MKLDIGCGKNKKEGFIGVDQYEMEGVDLVCDLGAKTWKFKEAPSETFELIEGLDAYGESFGELRQYVRLKDNSVDEVHSSHFLEHLTNFNDKWERVNFLNELYRVMKPGAKATIVIPHWNSNRYYGDPTHKEPFGEMAMYYLSKEYRESQAPHTDKKWNPDGYDCNFEAVWGYGMNPAIMVRNLEYQQYAMAWYKEAIQDLHIHLTKK